jgi:hypothetical protein
VAEKQSRLFNELVEAAREPEDYAALMAGLTKTADRRVASTLWDLLGRERLPVNLAKVVQQGLIRAYLGERYYLPSQSDRAGKTAAESDAKHWIVSGNPIQRAVALAILSRVAPEEAVKTAGRLIDDTTLSDGERRDAFRAMLAAASSLDSVEAVRAAIEALGKHYVLRDVALAYLAGDTSALDTNGGGYLLEPGPVSQEMYVADRPIVPKPPQGLRPEHIRPWIGDKNPKTAAYAGYLLALLGDRDGLVPLLAYWKSLPRRTWNEDRLVVRAVAALDDSTRIPELRAIYKDTDRWRTREFYWTIRGMTGMEILKLRKQIRDEVGMNNLR